MSTVWDFIDKATGGSTKLEWFSDELIDHGVSVIDVVSEQGAKWVAEDARRLAPLGKRLGGREHLRMQIDVRKSKFKGGGYSVYAQGPRNYHRYYAIFVELGTSKMTARPFLRRALRRNKRRILNAYNNKLK